MVSRRDLRQLARSTHLLFGEGLIADEFGPRSVTFAEIPFIIWHGECSEFFEKLLLAERRALQGRQRCDVLCHKSLNRTIRLGLTWDLKPPGVVDFSKLRGNPCARCAVFLLWGLLCHRSRAHRLFFLLSVLLSLNASDAP